MTVTPPRRVYTPDDLLRLRGSPKRYELVDGKLEVLSVSALSSVLAGHIHTLLTDHLRSIGSVRWLFPEGTSFQCFSQYPDRVRKPDTSYVRPDRLTEAQVRTEGHVTVAPDLAVEVISPHDRAFRVAEKLGEWQDAGVPLIWLVYPNLSAVFVHYANGDVKEFRKADTLAGDPVLPGFAVPVADLFRLPA